MKNSSKNARAGRLLLWLGLPALLIAIFAPFAINFYVSKTSTENVTPVVINRKPVVKAETPTPPPPQPKTTTLIFGGDINLSRGVEAAMKIHGADWPLQSLASTLQSADIAVANLESQFRADDTVTGNDSLVLRAYPPGIQTLTSAGIDGVSLANNHVTDVGVTGLTASINILDSNNIQHAGAGLTPEAAHTPFIITKNGLTFAFLSYTYGVNFTSPGVYYAVTTNLSQLQTDITAAKSKADVVIVLAHFGVEYQATQNQAQETFAHSAIDDGASLVIGAHPHVPEPIELYKNGLIAYSLGNLVFDQEPGENRDHSALLQVNFADAKPATFTLLPYHIYNLSQPRLVTDNTEKQAIFNLFGVPGGTGIISP